MRRQAGFTLLELMIVVVIIAILSAIAIPTYRKYVVRSHRMDAQRALVDLAARQERFFYSNNTYTTELAGAGSTAGLSGSTSMAGPYYTISIPSASSTDYTITATAAGTQQRDDAACQTLTLDRSGAQTSTGTVTNDSKCWGK